EQVQVSWAGDENTWFEIIGVVGDVRRRALESAPEPEIYLSLDDHATDGAGYVLRGPATVGGSLALAGAVTRAVADVDPQLEEVDVRPFATLVSDALGERRTALLLTVLYAAAALWLTSVGIFGVVSFSVESRRRDLAIRLALGATHRRLVGGVLFSGLRLV